MLVEAYSTSAGAQAVAGQQAARGQVIHRAGADAKLGGNVGGLKHGHAGVSSGLMTPRPPWLAGSTCV